MLTCSVIVEYLKESCPLHQGGVFKPQGPHSYASGSTTACVGYGIQTLSFPGAQGHQCSSSPSCLSHEFLCLLLGCREVGSFAGEDTKSDKAFAFKPSNLVQLLIHKSYFCLMGLISQFWYISVHVKTVTCGRCLRKRN